MQFPPHNLSEIDRASMTASCRDCDYINKVPNAGLVLEEPDKQMVQIMHNGIKIVRDCYYGPWMTSLIQELKGHHEPQEEAVFYEVVRRLPKDANMIELGGFWAFYSLWFLKDQPARSSLVLEPDPNHLRVGQVNAQINGLQPFFLHGSAGGNYEKTICFKTESAGEINVSQYSVETLLRDRQWDRLSLLHIDIQGAETEVLVSCEPLFRRGAIDWVFVSTHSHWISGDPLTHQRCLEVLRSCGATIEVEHDVHESFSGDGLIVARFCEAPADWQPLEASYNRQSTSHFRHMAFDLADKNSALAEKDSQIAALKTALQTNPDQPSLNPHLQSRGSLLTLSSDCSLGSAGDSLLIFNDEVIGKSCRENASWELENVREFSSFIHSDRQYTLIDVGANIGLFTRQLLVLSDRIARIVCVEPDESNFRALQFNVATLKPTVELHNFALAERDGVAEFLRDLENPGNYSLNNDALRNRLFEKVTVPTRSTSEWAKQTFADNCPLLWKSDTQGSDELIVSQVPWEIWARVDVAMLEMWRIQKPDYDRSAFRHRLEQFPNRKLGDTLNVSTDDIFAYLSGDDWTFEELFLWKGNAPSAPIQPKSSILSKFFGRSRETKRNYGN